jgi:molecular chaperone HtpG
MNSQDTNNTAKTIPFKAETQQLLNILIHSLYKDKEVFIRELISNAADALTRVNFEMQTNRDLVDPDTELAVWITADKEKKTLTIRDTGIGMNQQDMIDNLGTIAHSGVRTFLEAVQVNGTKVDDLIGQFGVGFYSAFMVAEEITVISRSYRPKDTAIQWTSKGADTFSIQPADKADRGTTIILQLNDDASDYTQELNLRSAITKHSDYIPFPIYLGEEANQANRGTSPWRQQPRETEKTEYLDFYKQFTLDSEEPLSHTHIAVDAPVQMYALLYIPSTAERNIFSLRQQDGLKLYARKVLIQEYCQDLLPGYFRFIQGVVDSEDLPLNVSRESIQSTRIMAQLKKIITAKVIEMLVKLAKDKPEVYVEFWQTFRGHIKEGVATDQASATSLLPLLRFYTLKEREKWSSLDDYIGTMKEEQKKIFYILGEDERSIIHSPHLEIFHKKDIDVLLLTDTVDPFMLLNLDQYENYEFTNVTTEDLKEFDLDQTKESDENEIAPDTKRLLGLIKAQLGDKVSDVRVTDRLVESPVRLVDEDGAIKPEMQRVYTMLNREYETPKRVLEVNPNHTILEKIQSLNENHPLIPTIIDQIYDDALLIEGLHPEPANMITRVQKIIEAALDNPNSDFS